MKNKLLSFLIFLNFYQVLYACPEGTFPGIHTNYHQCFKFLDKKLHWYDADNDCKNYSGHLASLHGGDVNDYVVQQILTMVNSSNTLVWLGAWTDNVCTESGCGLQWTWTDGSDFSYSNFALGILLFLAEI